MPWQTGIAGCAAAGAAEVVLRSGPAEATRRVFLSTPESKMGGLNGFARGGGKRCAPGEGGGRKTDAAANLVAALARHGERALLAGAGLQDDMQREH